MSLERYKEKNILRAVDTFIPNFSINRLRDKLDYFKNTVSEQEYLIRQLRDEIKELKKYEGVKLFYESLSGYCLDMNITANIIQCGFRVSKNKCRISESCKTRRNFLKQIGID